MVTPKDILGIMEEANLPVYESTFQADAPLVKQGLDSLDIADLILAVEKKYNKTIPVEQAAQLRTVNDIVNFLNT